MGQWMCSWGEEVLHMLVSDAQTQGPETYKTKLWTAVTSCSEWYNYNKSFMFAAHPQLGGGGGRGGGGRRRRCMNRPCGDMSRLTLSSTSRKSSLRRYLMPSRRQPICPVTWLVIWDCSSFVWERGRETVSPPTKGKGLTDWQKSEGNEEESLAPQPERKTNMTRSRTRTKLI